MVIERLRDQGVHEAVRSAEPSEDDIAASREFSLLLNIGVFLRLSGLACGRHDVRGLYKEIKEVRGSLTFLVWPSPFMFSPSGCADLEGNERAKQPQDRSMQRTCTRPNTFMSGVDDCHLVVWRLTDRWLWQVLFDRLCSTFSRHDRLMVNLKDDIMQAVYQVNPAARVLCDIWYSHSAACHQDYSPSVATENTYFDRFPYFLLYDEYLRKTNNMSDQIQNLLEQRNETILGSKVIRTTTERELERMQNLFKQVAWSAWVNFIHSKHQTIAVVKDRCLVPLESGVPSLHEPC
eukprot:2298363-Rhodomonas_salina.1